MKQWNGRSGDTVFTFLFSHEGMNSNSSAVFKWHFAILPIHYNNLTLMAYDAHLEPLTQGNLTLRVEGEMENIMADNIKLSVKRLHFLHQMF